MEIDEVMERIAGFGPAQKKIFYSLTMYHLVVIFQVLVFTFIGEEPLWACKDKFKLQPTVTNSTTECEMLDTGKCNPEYFTDFTTIVTEWNLICSKSSFSKLSQSAFFVGSLIGAWVWGIIADKIGRKKVYFITTALLVPFGFGCGFSTSYYSFVFFRVCVAFSASGLILSGYVLSVEIVGVSSRTFVGIVGGGMSSLGYPILAVLAYFVRDWRMLVFITSGSGITLFALIKIIPESPRWLLVNGHAQEARTVLADMARGNGTVMPQEELKLSSNTSKNPVGPCCLLSRRVIRKRTILLFVMWFTECMVYYALAMSTGDLGGDRYASFALSGVVEIPAYFVAYKMMNRIGRRWIHSSLLLCAGVSCLIWTLMGNDYLGVFVALLGKSAVSGAFNVLYLYTAELFPTEVRNIGVGVSTVGARLGGIFAPIVLMTAKYDRGLPMFVMGLLALSTGLLSLTLPETLNKPMPDTLSDL